jgi:hypothetical protein
MALAFFDPMMAVHISFLLLPFKMLEEINQDNPVKVLSKEEIVLFLQVQHAQGNIIYFPLPGLRKMR